MFYEKGNKFNMFVRPQCRTQCVLVRNTECKPNFCVFTIKPHRTPLINISLHVSEKQNAAGVVLKKSGCILVHIEVFLKEDVIL